MTAKLAWTIDAEVYPREAIFASCRRWSAELSFKITKSSKKRWKISATGKAGISKPRMEEIRDSFEDEVMHQQLRSEALKNSGTVRDALVMRALISASTEET